MLCLLGSSIILAYKNRDIDKLSKLFKKDARENGNSIEEVILLYKKNFNSLDIMAYDIKFKDVVLDDQIALVKGDFIILFKSTEEDRYERFYGDINWLLSWHGDNWLINEINYDIIKTQLEDDLN